MKRFVLGLGLVALAALTTACSGGGAATAAPADPGASPAADGIVVVAKDLKFLTTSVTAPADEPFEIVLDNQEAVPHNIAVSDASGANLFKGTIVTSTKVSNAIPALAAGSYTFICEVHPDMKGTITAS